MPEVMESPYKQARDGPSRQLLWELGKLQIDYQEEFQAKLDKDAGDRESAHRAALAAAVVEHERIRRSAEIEREKLEIQIQLERTRREAEERRELEQQQQDKVEKELAEKRKNIERTKAAEIAQMKAIQEHRAEQAAAEAAEQQRLKEEKEEAAIAAKKLEQKQETERLARERERERERQRAQEQEQEQEQKLKREADVVQVVPPLAQVTPISAEIPSQDTQQPKNGTKREAEHSRYILIHQKLKELRRYMADQGRQDLNLKKRMGEMRRTIKKCVGQLTGEKTANKAPRDQIIETLKAAALVSYPHVDITTFLAVPPDSMSESQGPALLVYQLNIFSKAIVSQFINEAGVAPKSADPVGVIASTVFAASEFRWNGIPLIDILIAKYHVACPVLFGIYGNDVTNEGKRRSGWIREDKTGPWITEQRHSERMTGLGAGFASLALRSYDKTKLENPYPIYHFWSSLAGIVNVPPQQASSTHFTVLKAMIENNESRILDFFGDAGILALRKALIQFPQAAESKSVAGKAVTVLPDVLRRDKKLFL
ncbi:hypothetical protein MMC19_001125 [Ptychographa xylographoides]|nr:hypothetical protein [Ptychographa xylographoides]